MVVVVASMAMAVAVRIDLVGKIFFFLSKISFPLLWPPPMLPPLPFLSPSSNSFSIHPPQNLPILCNQIVLGNWNCLLYGFSSAVFTRWNNTLANIEKKNIRSCLRITKLDQCLQPRKYIPNVSPIFSYQFNITLMYSTKTESLRIVWVECVCECFQVEIHHSYHYHYHYCTKFKIYWSMYYTQSHKLIIKLFFVNDLFLLALLPYFNQSFEFNNNFQPEDKRLHRIFFSFNNKII